MFWRRSAAPKELLEQADVVAELTRAVARYFREPSEPSVVAAKSRSRSARDCAKASKAGVKEGGREDWLAVSAQLAVLGDSAYQAVAQAKLYGVGRDARTARIALALREAAVEFGQALHRCGEPRRAAAHLVEAKRSAAGAAQEARRARGASLEDARVVVGLKEIEVFQRLAEAAEAAQAAADVLAGLLSLKA